MNITGQPRREEDLPGTERREKQTNQCLKEVGKMGNPMIAWLACNGIPLKVINKIKTGGSINGQG